ncbi:MAG: hypothetical protein RL071_2643 [Pseudomonadota bacterium]
MHLELLPVAALLRMDTELDALKREAGELSAKVERAKARVQAAEAEVQRVDADAKACAERQAGLEKQRKVAAERGRNLKAQLEAGALMDYAAALHQQDTLAAQLNTLDDAILAEMEAADGLVAARAEAVERKGIAEAWLRDSLDGQRRRRPDLELRHKELVVARRDQHAQLRAELRRPYDELRDRKKPILVALVGGACAHCRFSAPPQVIHDVQLGQKLLTCRGCGCWLTGVDEPEEADEAEDEGSS